jgi:transglutaminase-like putative cysteine protease
VIYRVRHVTEYKYETPVDLGAHIAHLRPRRFAFQRVLSAGLHVEPGLSWRREAVDHFGNLATWLVLDVPHAAFEVTAESVVDTCFPDPPAPESTPPWEDVAAAAWSGAADCWQAAEFLFDSPMVAADPSTRAYAASSFLPGRPVLEALLDLNARIKRDFAFKAGVTTTKTTLREVMERRQGVCQDFTHLMISALRGMGLPARYVSGYIRTRPPKGLRRRLGADQSHAWVGCWLGPAHGWLDLDPTNDLVVKDEHVVLGWGRDFGDVTPLQGIILGGGEHELSVRVELEPAL